MLDKIIHIIKTHISLEIDILKLPKVPEQTIGAHSLHAFGAPYKLNTVAVGLDITGTVVTTERNIVFNVAELLLCMVVVAINFVCLNSDIVFESLIPFGTV